VPIQRKIGLPVDASWECAVLSTSGVLIVRTGTGRFPIKGGTFTIQTVAVMVNTAPTGASLIVDVNKNGTTIYGTQSNRPTIAASGTSATVGAHSVTSVTDGDYLTVDVDQIGSTVPGSDLTVVVRLQRVA
jgi:lipopolysaccharide export system protein LptA